MAVYLFSLASCVMARPVAEMSRPAPAVVLHPASGPAALKSRMAVVADSQTVRTMRRCVGMPLMVGLRHVCAFMSGLLVHEKGHSSLFLTIPRYYMVSVDNYYNE
jgi:hypothetical protein